MYKIEGVWSGYVSGQRKVVHRVYLPKNRKKFAEAVRALRSILYTDGTVLDLHVSEVARKGDREIHGYDSLIESCVAQGVRAVGDLRSAS